MYNFLCLRKWRGYLLKESIRRQRGILPTIHYFRGIAALLVILHHITGIMYLQFNYEYLNGYFNPGWSGVDFFFVLSGFIIAYIHYGELGQNNRLKPFITKRLVRVYPIYWVVTLLYLPIFLKYGNGDVSIIKSFLLLPQDNQPILEVGWTLCFEMFFYLLFSLTFVLKPRISVMLASVWFVSVLFNLPNISNEESVSYFNFIFSHYNLEFLLGCVVAYSVKKFNITFAEPILMLGVISFLGSWIFINLGIFDKFSVLRILCFGVSSALIILGAASIDLKRDYSFTMKPLAILGDASYSLYLTHIPIYTVINKVFLVCNLYNILGLWITTTLLVISTTILGCVFHKLVEKPLLLALKNKSILNLLKGFKITQKKAS